MATRVGFIGLGNIGKPMAMNIAKAGFDLMVYDIREEPLKELATLGAKVAQSAKEIGEYGEIIELVVLDDAQVEAVMLGEGGVLEGVKSGSVIAVHSTVHPRTVKKVAEKAKIKGVGVIDAQISGGERGAQNKTLCYMVGGDKELFERCRPVFATSGATIFHVGELGMGAIAKLAHNVIFYINMLAASEGMRLAEKAGLDLKTLQDIVHVGAGQSRIADNWLQQWRFKDYSTGLQGLLQLIYKDLRLALEVSHDLELSLPGAALAQQLIARTLEIEGKTIKQDT
jgi:2-hydroxy-3-oxopropionate reductase